MPDLATLQEVKSAIRVDFSDDDTMLSAYLSAASQGILNYLKESGYEDFYDGENLIAAIPPEVKVAAMIWTEILFDDEPSNDNSKFGILGYPPPRVCSLLGTRRKPALA